MDWQLYSTKNTSNEHNSKSLSNYSNLLLKSYDILRHGNITEIFFNDNESGKGTNWFLWCILPWIEAWRSHRLTCIFYMYRPLFTNTSQYNFSLHSLAPRYTGTSLPYAIYFKRAGRVSMHNTDKVRNADSHTAGRSPLTVQGSNDLVRTTASSQAMNRKYPAYNTFFTVFGTSRGFYPYVSDHITGTLTRRPCIMR